MSDKPLRARAAWPALTKILHKYPDMNVEMIADDGLSDIVAERYDAGLRLAEPVDKDTIARRIGPAFELVLDALRDRKRGANEPKGSRYPDDSHRLLTSSQIDLRCRLLR